MIPIRLELRNFMSYGEQVTPLELRGMHVACLTGDNGHGKSALLDAITWALWGEARASSDELIRLGSDEMRVVFDFQLGDDLYRVIRGRSKKSSSSLWEIYVAENGGKEERKKGSEGHQPSAISHEASPIPLSSILPFPHSPSWRPITGQGVRDTGRLIQRILRMDYKTFINSAYIQQGRADEFTKQTVSDRKKILADILDLSRYDILEQRAKEKRNEAEDLIQDLDRDIAAVDAELAHEEDYKTQLAERKSERETVEAEIARTETRIGELQKKKTELDAAANRIREIGRLICEWQTEVEGLLCRKSEQEGRIARYREIIADQERITSGVERLADLRNRIADLDRRLEELRRLDVEQKKLEMAIQGERDKLEMELKSRSAELAEIEKIMAQAPAADKDAADLRAKVIRLDELDARRNAIQSEVTGFSDRMGELKAQRDRLDEKRKDLEEKLQLLSEPGAQCPLCKTELGHEKHDSIVADYMKQIEEAIKAANAINAEGIDIKKKRQALESESAAIERQLKDGSDIRRRLAQVEHLQSQVEEARKQEPKLRERVTSLETRLKSEDFAQEFRTRLAEIQKNLAALEYDADAHSKMREEIAGLQGFESLAANLKVARESLPADESSLKAITDLIAAREKSIAENRQSATELGEALREYETVNSELAAASDSLQSLRARDGKVRGEIAVLDHSLARCKSLKAEGKEKRKALDKAKKDRAVYTDLVAAFGKKGVQALIIENAIPEIQEEANRLLARMTDNAMQVSLETVRDKKTGGTAETLDIKISDDMGTRSYELYSGGEAFRVNFALRIALSKLLARRAGARLQTLIIDEGFGTQDGKGREKLVEAIDSIKDDFEKILVITHIDELKDAFPTQIQITKDSSGSQISVD